MNAHLTPLTPQVDPAALLRLPQVLALVPVCASTWWAGVRSGKFPKPLKLGPPNYLLASV
jgi:predicted DNA-binding transcriptional regulator AlpA